MSMAGGKHNTAALTPEARAAWYRLFAGSDVTLSAEGLFLRGPGLDVVVSVWPSETEGHFDTHVTSLAGGKRVRLDGVRLLARAEDQAGVVLRVAQVTGRGDLSIKGLRQGLTYRLHSPVVVGASGQPLRLPVRGREVVAAAAGPEAETAPWEWPVYKSTEGKVLCTVRPEDDTTVVLVFETNERQLAGATVRFALVQASGRVEQGGEMQLEAIREGRWGQEVSVAVPLPAPCELVFDVLPAD